jgi:hypothetical protein
MGKKKQSLTIILSNMEILASHVYSEGNQVAYYLQVRTSLEGNKIRENNFCKRFS